MVSSSAISSRMWMERPSRPSRICSVRPFSYFSSSPCTPPILTIWHTSHSSHISPTFLLGGGLFFSCTPPTCPMRHTSDSSHLSPAFLLVKARSRSDRRASSSSCACYESASSPGWLISPVCQSPFFPYLTFKFVCLVQSRQGGDAARAARQPRRAAQGDRAQIVLEIARVGDLSSASASIVPVSSLSA